MTAVRTRKPFRIRVFVRREIDELAIDLANEIDELRQMHARRSERWRASEEAVEVEAWIERLEHLANDLNNITDTPPEG